MSRGTIAEVVKEAAEKPRLRIQAVEGADEPRQGRGSREAGEPFSQTR